MYLFFDTETTGLPKNWKAPLEDLDNWPRIVQMAWLIYDHEGNKKSCKNYIIAPSGFTIPKEASAIHGISTKKAIMEGVSLIHVLEDYRRDLASCDYIIAHNLNYDINVLGAEYLRAENSNPLSEKTGICTMLKSIDFCAIQGPYGYKWPKLSELHIKLFGKDFEDAHDALADINATANCFIELIKKGVIVNV